MYRRGSGAGETYWDGTFDRDGQPPMKRLADARKWLTARAAYEAAGRYSHALGSFRVGRRPDGVVLP
ncbi:MAG: hypothetical protein KGL39_14600 [Patescibacteria group bacterium]|nr:hypothetical protein [Patescibacteria group bacterium]